MMSVVLAEKRISDFERKYGEVALQLAYHAALPVALNTDLLHLLRINFFIDPPKSLPYTAEFELLLSPLCREIDEGLYEIEPEIRDILLQGLYSIDLGQRVKDVATLLWQYIDRDAVWIDRVELERAQQLTVLNFLDPEKADDWLAEVESGIDSGQSATRDWYVAMCQDLERQFQPQLVKALEQEYQRNVRRDNFSMESKPYFSTLRTGLTDLKILKDALQELEISIKTEIDVRGRLGINATIRANVVAVLDGECDLGWSENPAGSLDLVADLRGISKKHDLTKIINKIHQKYAELKQTKDISEQINAGRTPKVFVSYSHDSKIHTVRVVELANKLRQDGIDVTIDQYEDTPPQGWKQWMIDQIKEADFVLIVCTEQYNLRFNSNESKNKGRGVEWEGSIIIQEIYNAQGQDFKFIPIALNLGDSKFIPAPLNVATCYQLYNDDGYKSLYRRLTNQPKLERRELPPIIKSSSIKMPTTDESTPAVKTTRSKKQPDAAKLRKIQENIAILRDSRSNDLEKISALKVLGRIAGDNEQVIQSILFLIRINKNNDVIAEAAKSLGKIGKKNTDVLQEMVRLLRSSPNNLIIIEALTSLAKIGNTGSTTIRAILHLLALNKNSLVVINIMTTFAIIAKGNNEVIQKILSLLQNNNDTNVEKSMIESLGEIASGNKSAINQLISILRFSPNTPILKQFAANSLGKIAVGDKGVILAMESELRFSSSKTVKDRIAVNLNKIDPGNKVAADYRAKIRKTRSTKK
jgi:SEFIR domain/Protein of unknown function (DUF1257)